MPVLQRLSQHLERLTRELGELVEEKHTTVREGNLPRHRVYTTTEEADGTDRVVRRTEWPLGDEASAALLQPHDGVDARDLKGLIDCERR